MNWFLPMELRTYLDFVLLPSELFVAPLNWPCWVFWKIFTQPVEMPFYGIAISFNFWTWPLTAPYHAFLTILEGIAIHPLLITPTSLVLNFALLGGVVILALYIALPDLFTALPNSEFSDDTLFLDGWTGNTTDSHIHHLLIINFPSFTFLILSNDYNS